MTVLDEGPTAAILVRHAPSGIGEVEGGMELQQQLGFQAAREPLVRRAVRVLPCHIL